MNWILFKWKVGRAAEAAVDLAVGFTWLIAVFGAAILLFPFYLLRKLLGLQR